MIDFVTISVRETKRGSAEIYPKFLIKKSSDLMIRGGDFYAVWVEEKGFWSTDEQDAFRMIDRELDLYLEANKHKYQECRALHMWDANSGMVDAWHKYCQKQLRDSYHMLDEKLIFSNMETTKKDHASKALPYPLEEGDCSSYDKLMSVLYSEEERKKIEWAIGAIVSGESKKLQKFLVLYGAAGTGKSTVLGIIEQLFEGYYAVFDAKALGSANNSFALESFKTNPLVAIQHDGDLSRIEDNTRLNSLVSHEMMTVNEKFKSTYANRFKSFLFMGTNKPVRITDAKSGLIRRLIDVSPSGNKIPQREYNRIMKQIPFELGAIAYHCQQVYLDSPAEYDGYIPIIMLGASNDFYNFVEESYSVFEKQDGTTGKAAWAMYQKFCEDAKVPYPLSQRAFKEELKNYFWDYKNRDMTENGERLNDIYRKFRKDRFENVISEKKPGGEIYQIQFEEQESFFDKTCADLPAQYATDKETPMMSWSRCLSKLSDIDTSKVHYVKVPENHIVIDFDIQDKDGNKLLERNIEEASKWPETYAELSKSGCGVHLHYIYTGDVSKVSRIFDENIEIKVFTGNSSLRRKLTKCNDLPIATLSSGLPLKGDEKLIDNDVMVNEKGIRTLIKKNLNKEYHPGTKPSIDFIFKILDGAYNKGVAYDVTDMKPAIISFAAGSTHQADYCLKLVTQMKFKSEEAGTAVDIPEAPIAFYDVEIFPNLFLVNYRLDGDGRTITRLINPLPRHIEELLKYRLIGFNNRRFDNHLLYACLMGYSTEQLYHLSQKIINTKKGESRNCLFGEAYNLSYADIYDFSSKKQSLKKWEIELGIHHLELGLPWDQPVPENLWTKVAEYCDNDVESTYVLFHHLKGDWAARLILSALSKATPNDTTNTHSALIIFDGNKHPQDQFNYRNLAEPVMELDEESYNFLMEVAPEMLAQKHGEARSLLPYFPGYKFECGKSTYWDEEVSEGGYVYSEPGMYGNVALLDIASMHPTSLIVEILFGLLYTRRFADIKAARIAVKHRDRVALETLLGGELLPFYDAALQPDAEYTLDDLAYALKIVINMVYGMTSAKFENAFKDPRNVDNIVAKRGALFMIDLKHEVQNRGFTVAHIKTDSIKIPDATPEIIEFVMAFGKQYGYNFEHEATYDRMCLVNKAVYIAKYATTEKCQELYGYAPGDNAKHGGEWTATGDQFAVPYVFKTMFTHEPIAFEDMCETFNVSKGDLYLDMNEKLPDVSGLEKEMEKYESDYKKGKLSDTHFETLCAEIADDIAAGHKYQFVGRVGQFCPMKPGANGGILYRRNEGKNYAASGTTGYRWLESEMVRELGKEEDIDKSYYEKLVNDAIMSISLYGDYYWFVSDDPYIGPKFEIGDYMNHPVYSDEIPFN